jgi:hypothetical protein
MLIKMRTTLLLLLVLANTAYAQIGWTLDQCRKHWGQEQRIFHPNNGASTEYTFGSKIEKLVTLDQQGKVNELFYSEDEKDGLLNIPELLAMQKAVIWEIDTEIGYGKGASHQYWLGKKDGVVLFHACYFAGKIGESLHVLPIDSPLDSPPISKGDADWARANPARIEAEKKAKEAAGPSAEELARAAHDAEIRRSNERA